MSSNRNGIQWTHSLNKGTGLWTWLRTVPPFFHCISAFWVWITLCWKSFLMLPPPRFTKNLLTPWGPVLRLLLLVRAYTASPHSHDVCLHFCSALGCSWQGHVCFPQWMEDFLSQVHFHDHWGSQEECNVLVLDDSQMRGLPRTCFWAPLGEKSL